MLEKLKSALSELKCTEVPLFDSEVIGYYGVRALGSVAFSQQVLDDARYAYIKAPYSSSFRTHTLVSSGRIH